MPEVHMDVGTTCYVNGKPEVKYTLVNLKKKLQSKLPYSVTLDTARMDTAVSVKGAWVVVTAG